MAAVAFTLAERERGKPMTEVEWLQCDHPGTLMQGRRGWRRTTRKLRLLACACYRRIWPLLPKACRTAIEVAERHADGEATNDELHAMQPAKPPTVQVGGPKSDFLDCGVHYAAAPSRDFRSWATTALAFAAMAVAEGGTKREVEVLAQCHLAREILGNPFRPVTVSPGWLTTTVTKIASAAYGEPALPSGEFDTARLGVLADALEDAGCQDAELLGHLRHSGPHVRGCWAVDLLLGKT